MSSEVNQPRRASRRNRRPAEQIDDQAAQREAAERRLLQEYVVVPILFLQEATLLVGAKGLGTDEARRNPGFVGSLVSAER